MSEKILKSTPLCPRCEKPLENLCFCKELPLLTPKQHILILQHPQEPDKILGTARLTQLQLEGARLRVGLSWQNLGRAWEGKPHEREKEGPGKSKEPVLDPKRWAVLYLGSGVKGQAPKSPLVFVDRQGKARNLAEAPIGLVVLDGTWSQAKALWWRNPWLLKLSRCLLADEKRPSLYGKMRKEPRGECLSTLESVGRTLTALGNPPAIEQALDQSFSKLLALAKNRKR